MVSLNRGRGATVGASGGLEEPTILRREEAPAKYQVDLEVVHRPTQVELNILGSMLKAWAETYCLKLQGLSVKEADGWMGHRERILEFISENPGLNGHQIEGRLGIKRVARPYFSDLENEGLIFWRDGWYVKEAET